MSIKKKEILKRFRKWIGNHPDVFDEDRLWYVQNVVGDIVGWDKEYTNFVELLEVFGEDTRDEEDKKIDKRLAENEEVEFFKEMLGIDLDDTVEVTDELQEGWMEGIESKKDIFTEVMTFIVDKHEKREKLCNAWEDYHGDYLFLDGDWETMLVKLLEEYMEDFNEDISYWLYELNYGRDAKKDSISFEGKNIPIKTIEDLYNLITEDDEC